MLIFPVFFPVFIKLLNVKHLNFETMNYIIIYIFPRLFYCKFMFLRAIFFINLILLLKLSKFAVNNIAALIN